MWKIDQGAGSISNLYIYTVHFYMTVLSRGIISQDVLGTIANLASSKILPIVYILYNYKILCVVLQCVTNKRLGCCTEKPTNHHTTSNQGQMILTGNSSDIFAYWRTLTIKKPGLL